MTGKIIDKKSRIVLIHAMGDKISGKNPVFLFSTTQVEEIINTIIINPVPFSPDYLLGVCLWRKQVIPVVDTTKRCGLQSQQSQKNSQGNRYLVVNTVGQVNGDKKLLQGVLKISDQIVTTEIPDFCTPADVKSSNIDQTLIKAIFEYQTDLMIIPDLASIFGSI